MKLYEPSRILQKDSAEGLEEIVSPNMVCPAVKQYKTLSGVAKFF